MPQTPPWTQQRKADRWDELRRSGMTPSQATARVEQEASTPPATTGDRMKAAVENNPVLAPMKFIDEALDVVTGGRVPRITGTIGQGVANLPYAFDNLVKTTTRGLGNIAGAASSRILGEDAGLTQTLRNDDEWFRQNTEATQAERPHARGFFEAGAGLGADLAGAASPFFAMGRYMGPMANAASSAALTGTQSMAGPEGSSVSMLGDALRSKAIAPYFGQAGDWLHEQSLDPVKRVALDVALDGLFNAGGVISAVRRAGKSLPQAADAAASAAVRSAPETDPSRILPRRDFTPTAPMNTSPQFTPPEPVVTPPVDRPRIIIPEPNEIPVSGRDGARRSRQKQTELIASVRKTAEKLERERTANRAVPLENEDASAAIAGAAGGRRIEDAVNPPRIVNEFGNRPGQAVMNEVVLGGVGAGAGGLTGYTQGDTPEERAMNAGLGAIGGAAAAIGGGRLYGRALDMALDGVRKTPTDLPVRNRKMYRGVPQGFDESRASGRTYFTPSRQYAKNWAGSSGRVEETTINPSNPLDLRDLGATPISREQIASELSARGVDIDADAIRTGINSPDWVDRPMPVWGWMQQKSINDAIKRSGFDAVGQIESTLDEGKLSEAWFTFKDQSRPQSDPLLPDDPFMRRALEDPLGPEPYDPRKLRSSAFNRQGAMDLNPIGPENPIVKFADKQIASSVHNNDWNPEVAAMPAKPSYFLIGAEDALDLRIGHQAGSNPGGLFLGTDGRKRYIKAYTLPEQAIGEVVANELYRMAGETRDVAPRANLIDAGDGRLWVGTDYIEGLEKLPQDAMAARAALDYWPMDVITANWDAVGMGGDNLLHNPLTGHIYRIDNGGAFLSRANAGLKPDDVLRELTEIDGFITKNPDYAKLFHLAGVKPADLAERALKIVEQLEFFADAEGSFYNLVDGVVPKGTDRGIISRIADMLAVRTLKMKQWATSQQVWAKVHQTDSLVDNLMGGAEPTKPKFKISNAPNKPIPLDVVSGPGPTIQDASAPGGVRPSPTNTRLNPDDSPAVRRAKAVAAHKRAIDNLPLGSDIGDYRNTRLVATHNTSTGHLAKLLSHEGIPSPSLGVRAVDGSDLWQWGDAEVMMRDHLVDPANVPTWKGDAYTPRTPNLDYIMEAVDKYKHTIRQEGGPELNRVLDEILNEEKLGGRWNTIPTDKWKELWNPKLAVELQKLAHPGEWGGREMTGSLLSMTNDIDDGTRQWMLRNYGNTESLGAIRTAIPRKFQSLDELRRWAHERLPSVGTRAELANLLDVNKSAKEAYDKFTERSIELAGLLTGPDAPRNLARFSKNGPVDLIIGRTVAELEAKMQEGIDPSLVDSELYKSFVDTFGRYDVNAAAELKALPPNRISLITRKLRRVYEALDQHMDSPDHPYAEAKPPRVVKWDEVAGVRLRYNPSKELAAGLRSRDIPWQVAAAKARADYGRHSSYAPGTATQMGKARDWLERKRFANELEREGRNPMRMADPVAGMATGAIAGQAEEDEGATPEERMMTAFMYALGGAAVGAAGMAAIRKMGGRGAVATTARKAATASPPIATAADTRTPYAKGVADGTLGVPRDTDVLTPGTRQGLHRDVAVKVRAALAAKGYTKVTVSDETLGKLASVVDVDELDPKAIATMDNSQLEALGNRVAELDNEVKRLADEMGKAPPERLAELEPIYDETFQKLVQMAEMFTAVKTERGRGLRLAARIATGSVESAIGVARRMLGVRELSPELVAKFRAIVRDPSYTSGKAREAAMAGAIRESMKLPWWKVVLDARRVGLLTSPATWVVNTTGNVGEATVKNFLVMPMAAAFDNAWSAMTGAKRTISMAGRGKGFKQGLGEGATIVKQRTKDVWDGKSLAHADLTESGYGALAGNQVDYVRDVGGIIGEKPAKVMQGVSDLVYTVMDAADQPFYRASLDATYRERATLKAMNEGLKRGTKEFDEFVANALRLGEDGRPAGMDEVDHIVAQWEALDDTFKTDTLLSRWLRESPPSIQAVAGWAIPFVKTPTNLIRKAFEAMPGIGFAVSEAHLNGLKKQFAKAGIPAEEVATELRRARTLNGAKQLSVGATFVLAGYLLTEAGMLTGDYVSPMARDDADTEDANRRKMTNQPPLSISLDGKTAHNLSAFAQFAPLLALGHSIATAVKEERKLPDRNLLAAQDRTERDRKFASNVSGRALISGVRTVGEFPMLQGVKNFTDLLQGEKAGDIGGYLGREAATLVPASAAVASVGRLMDPVAKRQGEGFVEGIQERLPFLRERLPAKVGSMGEVTERVDPFSALFSPTRPQRMNSGPLYDALDEIGFYPSAARKSDSESYADYSARRQVEGAAERDLLQAVLDGDPQGWSYVGDKARRDFQQTGDWKGALQSALSRQRTAVSRERQMRQPRPVP